jgi:hypothetical protein
MKKKENKDKIDEKIVEKNNEPPLKRTRRNSVVAENDTQIKPVCPGCFPIFQENQLGHYGPNGCLGDEFTLDDTSKYFSFFSMS